MSHKNVTQKRVGSSAGNVYDRLGHVQSCAHLHAGARMTGRHAHTIPVTVQ